jgi:hypothetical protein
MIYFVTSIFPPWNIETPFTPWSKKTFWIDAPKSSPHQCYFSWLRNVGEMAIASYGRGGQMASACV